MEFEYKDGVCSPKPLRFEDWADDEGYCAGYARRASVYLLTGEKEDFEDIIWNRADAWNFGYKNRVVWKRGIDGDFNPSNLKEGQILGIYYPPTNYRNRRDERVNIAQLTHLATCIGNFVINGDVSQCIIHNLEGELRVDSLRGFLRESRSMVMEVYSPKNKSIK